MFLIYSIIPIILEISNATYLNINLLTADFYSVIFGVFIKKYEVRVNLYLLFIELNK
jgi:solute carrier family 35, member F1/2